MLMTCPRVQLGPLLVLIPAIIWLYWSGDSTPGHGVAGMELRGGNAG